MRNFLKMSLSKNFVKNRCEMTREEFYKLAISPNIFDKESIFRLVLYHFSGNEKGYVKVEGKNEWKYSI